MPESRMPALLTEDELRGFENAQLVHRFGSAKSQAAKARMMRPFPPTQTSDEGIERRDKIAEQLEGELLRRLEGK